MKRILLTFDIEDFINSNEVEALRFVLKLLSKHDLKAVFFLTGHVAERLSGFPCILDLLRLHEIGFHSSGHSIHPTIPEYTDVRDYEKAREISFERETSHINPFTGETEGRGGICVLQELFKEKKIEAFRAPGMSWTPPNLEALHDLGVRFDFSSNLSSSEPLVYRGLTFYPYTFIQEWNGTVQDYYFLVSAVLRRKITIFNLHPTLYVNRYEWDSIFYKGNPTSLTQVPERDSAETAALFRGFDLFLKRIKDFEKAKVITTSPRLVESTRNLKIGKCDVETLYDWSMRWPRKRFQYNPKYVKSHFFSFFEEAYS